MAIRTLEREEHGPYTLSLVEITYGRYGEAGYSRSTAWEFQCDECGALDSGLTEEEARAELTEHVHKESK